MPTAHRIDPLQRANLSLAGLSTGDAFGEALMSAYVDPHEALEIPPGPWQWTDDTNMGLSIVEVLTRHGGIDQDALAHSFIKRFMEQPHRGYGRGAYHLLRAMANGRDWREAAPIVFPGGSKGNGAAMRAGPIGGYFGADPPRAAAQARASAEVTHAHPEGQAGAMAVAAAAAIASCSPVPSARDFLTEVLGTYPKGPRPKGSPARWISRPKNWIAPPRSLGPASTSRRPTRSPTACGARLTTLATTKRRCGSP